MHHESEPDNVDVGDQLSDNNNQNTPTQADPVTEESNKQLRSKKRHHVNPLTLKVNQQKENRKLGKGYVGRGEKNGKSVFTLKNPRAMKQRCNSNTKDAI